MPWISRFKNNLSLKISFFSSFVLCISFLIALPVILRLKVFEHNPEAGLLLLLCSFFALTLQFLITAFLVYGFALKPLETLKNTMKKIEEGQLETQLPLTTSDEMSEVFESFNHMIVRMQKMNERKNNIENRLTKTEQSLKYKDELQHKSQIIERMNQELSQSFNNLALLYNVSQTLNASLDMNDVLAAVDQIFTQKFLCKNYLLALSLEGGPLKVVLGKGFTHSTQNLNYSIEEGQGIMGSVGKSNKSVLIPDLRQSHLLKSGLENELHGSLFSTPLFTRGKLLGVILVARSSFSAFTSSDRQALESIASQMANAFDRSVLYTQTKELAVRDELTNLYNRRYFQMVIDKEFKRADRYQRPLSVLMVDVDYFKSYNDTYGHLKGDITLKAIANILFNSIREVDVIARYGGEEFVVLLPNTELVNAVKVAEKLRFKVQEAFKVDILHATGKKPVPITISVGVASYPIVKSLGELVHAADMALYKAKRQGRNRVLAATSTEPDLFGREIQSLAYGKKSVIAND